MLDVSLMFLTDSCGYIVERSMLEKEHYLIKSITPIKLHSVPCWLYYHSLSRMCKIPYSWAFVCKILCSGKPTQDFCIPIQAYSWFLRSDSSVASLCKIWAFLASCARFVCSDDTLDCLICPSLIVQLFWTDSGGAMRKSSTWAMNNITLEITCENHEKVKCGTCSTETFMCMTVEPIEIQ